MIDFSTHTCLQLQLSSTLFCCVCFVYSPLQPLHVELLLLVYRRLVEDLLSFDSTLSQQRKADMLSELQTSMLGSVMSLIITVMQVWLPCMYFVHALVCN